MEDIFVKYDHAIIHEKDKVFYPLLKKNLNTPTEITRFYIRERYNFLNIKKAKFKINGKVLQKDGTKYPKGSNVILVDNFPGFLFESICVKKNYIELDRIDNVDRASLIKGTISYSANLCGPSIDNGGVFFKAVGNLSNLCLGFFKDIEYPVYRGGFEIDFIRFPDDDVLFRDKNDQGVLAEAGKVVINELIIIIPIVTYDDLNKTELVKELTLLSKRNEYIFSFKSWQCIKESNITGKKLIKDITDEYINNNNPLFVIVAFQTDKLNNCNLRNIWLEIDSIRYPEVLLNLDFKKEKFDIAYDMLMDYNRVYRDLSLMCITPEQFKNTRPFFAIDMNRQKPKNPNIFNYNSSIVLHVDFNEDVPDNTTCYIFLISKKEFFYDLPNNRIIENI